MDELSFLSEEDILLYKKNLRSEMSVFSKKTKKKIIDNYIYFETDDGSEIYYLNLYFYGARFFLDNEKKIIFHSNYYHEAAHSQFVPMLNNSMHIIRLIKNEDWENSILISENIVSCCKWFVTYGHFADEAYSLCDFYDKLQLNAKILLDYHTDDIMVKHYPVFDNYRIIQNYLFENTDNIFEKNSFNAYDFKRKILKINKLYLLKNDCTDKWFHSFPIFSSNKILSTCLGKFICCCKNVYISRGPAQHIKRNLENEIEIASYLETNNYTIINPEKKSFDEFVCVVNYADNIVITWGGALTNLCYFKMFTNVIILKSKSYEHENIFLFQKIIDTYKLNVKIILHEENKITIPFL